MAKETEVIFFAKIGNPEGLKEATKVIKQVQLEGKIDDTRRHRVRFEQIADSEPVYTYTTKLYKGNEEGYTECIEHDVVVAKEFADAFEPIADRLISKLRHIFPAGETTITLPDGREIMLPEISFEVDVYKTQLGGSGMSSWCRIEVELQEIFTKLEEAMPDYDKAKFVVNISDLPFEPTDFFNIEEATDEQKAIVEGLWKEWETPIQGQEEQEGESTPDNKTETEEGVKAPEGDGEQTPTDTTEVPPDEGSTLTAE